VTPAFAAARCATVFVLTIARAGFTQDPAGAARGYCHTFLEVGMIGERLCLKAVRAVPEALLPTDADTDEAAALVGLPDALASTVHFVTLDWSA